MAFNIPALRHYGRITALQPNYGITAELRHYGKCRNRNAVCRNITTLANELRLTSLVIFILDTEKALNFIVLVFQKKLSLFLN